MTERSQRSGSKGGLSARIKWRSCLFQPPHGILRIVSAAFSMLLFLSLSSYLILYPLIFPMRSHRVVSSPSRRAILQ